MLSDRRSVAGFVDQCVDRALDAGRHD